MTSKRNIESRLEALEEVATAERDRIEMFAEASSWWNESEPLLTEYFASRGFVIEREAAGSEFNNKVVWLHATPSAFDISRATLWYTAGPTVPLDAIRILWDEARLKQVLAAAEYPVEHETPEPPDDAVGIDEGDGWRAVVPADQAVENMIVRRSKAERVGYEILGDAPSWVKYADENDFVEVDAEPVASSDRP